MKRNSNKGSAEKRLWFHIWSLISPRLVVPRNYEGCWTKWAKVASFQLWWVFIFMSLEKDINCVRLASQALFTVMAADTCMYLSTGPDVHFLKNASIKIQLFNNCFQEFSHSLVNFPLSYFLQSNFNHLSHVFYSTFWKWEKSASSSLYFESYVFLFTLMLGN